MFTCVPNPPSTLTAVRHSGIPGFYTCNTRPGRVFYVIPKESNKKMGYFMSYPKYQTNG